MLCVLCVVWSCYYEYYELVCGISARATCCVTFNVKPVSTIFKFQTVENRPTVISLSTVKVFFHFFTSLLLLIIHFLIYPSIIATYYSCIAYLLNFLEFSIARFGIHMHIISCGVRFRLNVVTIIVISSKI